MTNTTFELETPKDYKAVERLTFDAFETMELPGRARTNEHFLAHIMRDSEAFIKELDFIGRVGEEIVANILYTRSKIIRDDGSETATVTFGPVSVKPKLHNRGIGSEIIRYSLDVARKLGHGAVIIVGHENYYPRFGFKPAVNYNLTMPDGSVFDAFMALELQTGYLGADGGKWYEDDVFKIEDRAFCEWNAEFLKAHKLVAVTGLEPVTPRV
ncbi:N-acetyltransferase [Synergistales bacterium]|nr:N-acetyltransferase [Synergistales bacterium]